MASSSLLVARSCARSLAASASRPAFRSLSTSRPVRQILGEGDKALFDKHVVQGKRITVVDFHADMLDPILQKVLTAEIEGENEVDYMKINTDNENDLAAKYKVSALPTVIAFKHGKELSRFVGLVNEEAVSNFVANAKDH